MDPEGRSKQRNEYGLRGHNAYLAQGVREGWGGVNPWFLFVQNKGILTGYPRILSIIACFLFYRKAKITP